MSSNILTQRICQFCGKEFTARTTVTKYCSHKCNQRDYKKRLKNQNINRSEKETLKPIIDQIALIQLKEILSLKEAALLLGVSRTTLHRMRKNGFIQFTQIGSKKMITKKELINSFNI